MAAWQRGAQMERLRALGIPVFYSEPKHLADIDKLGALLGKSSVAHDDTAKFTGDIADLRAFRATSAHSRVFYQVWDDPLMTLNAANVFSEVIALCGGENVFAAEKPHVPTISTEAVLAADPEAIVTAPDRPLPALDRWTRWPALKTVARGNLFGIDGDLINRPTPRLALGAAQLCGDLDAARKRRAK